MPIKSLLSSFQSKVMLLFLLVALVPVGIVGVLSIRTAEELIVSIVFNQLENVADDKVALLERWLSERKADLEVVAGSSIIKSMDPGQIGPYLELVRLNYMVYEGFLVISRDEEVIFKSSGTRLKDASEEWVKRALSGEIYMSEITLAPWWRESFFCISVPVFDDEGEVMGAVCGMVGTSAILSMILKVSLGETGECYIVDKNGTFLAHKEPRRILSENIAQSESFKNIFGRGQHKKIYIDYRGIEVLGTSRSVSGTGWYLVVEQDRDEAFKSADKLKHYFYMVIAFTIIGAILLAWLFSYYVVSPIRNLSEAANALAGGQFEDVFLRTNRRDEIGSLYSAFQDMARQLKAKQESLEKKVNLKEEELRETGVRLKKTEALAARSEQLAALGRLAAGVTHEIRTPVTSLKLFLESVKAEIEISPEYEEDFKVAMDQLRRMETTMNRFLDFAKPREPVFSYMEVREIIEDIILVIRPRANQQETVVDVIIEDGLPKLKGDKKQLGEALLNLMINSLEAMSNRGELTVRAALDNFDKRGEPQACIRIDIKDTGPGITEENMANLFDPFFTTKPSGTGLGLAIVQSTVSSHEGEIKVQSIINQGTTFSILLPVSHG